MASIELSDEDAALLDSERRRLDAAYGIELTNDQVMAAIIELHRLKLRSHPEQEDIANTIAWLRRRDDRQD